MMRVRLKPFRSLVVASCTLLAAASCRPVAPSNEYLFVWAGDSARTASDFLAVIDADPATAKYGAVVASVPTGAVGTHPHHTEASLGPTGHLLANGFHSGQTWLFDLTTPRQPSIITAFGDLANFSRPHTYLRLANGHVLVSFQYAASANSHDTAADNHDAMMANSETTGGLVEMDEQGTVIRSGSAVDTTIADRRLYPYSMVELPGIDRLLSTTTNMNSKDTLATAQWVQFWRQSAHAVIVLDVADPEHPREVSRVSVGDNEEPHWMAIDRTGRRVVVNSGGYVASNRLFVMNINPDNGQLTVDERFRDAGSTQAGVNLSARAWPHGFTGSAAPHGTVFSR